mmetsp:Transcript_27241/g.40992  ORF Transcript_27241/g.40992 Transcript_27241/m.40992 type:complete len:763 (+) Transcript_27241:116-2404(+)
MNNDQGGRKTSENDDTCAKGVIKRRKASIASDVKNVGGFPVAVLVATSHKEVEHSAGGRRTQEEEGGTNSLLPLSGGISPSHNNGTSESNGSDAQQERPLSPERALRLYRKRFKRRSSDNGSVPVSHYDHEEEQQKKQYHTTSTATTSPQQYQHQQVSQQQHYHHQHDDHLIDIPEELLQENNSAESSSPSGLCCQKGQGKGPTEQNQGEPSLLVRGDGSSSTLETAASLRSVAEDSDDSADTPALCPPPTCCGATTSASCSTGSSSGSSSSSTTMLGKRQNMIAALICILFCLSAIYSSAPSKTRDTDSGREFVESSSIEEYSKHNHILVFNDDNDQDPLPHTIIPKNQASPRERKKDNNSDTERQQEERPEENNAAAAAAGASIVYAKEQIDRQAIVRGEQVTNAQEEYPYVVSLLQRNWKGQAWHTCGGIMISPNVVLTVAHCEYSVDIVHIGLSRADHNKNRARRRLRGVDDNQFEIKPEGQIFDATGSKPSDSTTSQRRSLSSDGIQLHNLRNNNQFGRAYAVKSWHKIKHPKFNSKTGDYDFMLIKVPGWNEGTPTVRINDDASKPNGVLNEKTVVLGWGVTQTANSRSVSEVLRRASLQVMTNYKCGDMYEKIFSGSPITDRMLCAYSDNGRDACKGDSGGPLIVEHPKYRNKDLAVGLVSWGEECGNVNYPGVYSRISNVHDWITDTVCSKMSPESCLNYEIRRSFSPGEVCKDHVGTFQNSRYRSCSWVKRAKWITCRWYKDLCPVTCDVDKC